MDKVPKDRDSRLAFLEEWARWQHSRLASEERRRLYAEENARVVAQARQRNGQVDSLRQVGVIPVVITKPPDLPVDRAAVFADLITGLREHKWADPIVSECDERRYIAIKAIDLARRYRPGSPWLLYMEDDVILGPDFGLLPGLLSDADELFPHTGLVSFFSLTGEPGWSLRPMGHFNMIQCCAIRNSSYLDGLGSFGDYSDRWRYAPDVLLASFLAAEYDAYALWGPSLVQHAAVTPLFDPSVEPGTCISPSYKQAYG